MRVLTENETSRFEDLDREECLELLGWESLGRLATCDGAAGPVVVPVNFVLDGDRVVFRCAPGRAAALTDRHASFEIDRFDPFRKLGWSVLVSGRLVRVPADAYSDTVIAAWAPGDRSALLQLEPEVVSGRRIAQRPACVSDLGYL